MTCLRSTKSASIVGTEEDEKGFGPPMALKDILGADLEKDALLASDGFWDKFNHPTQEEQMLEEALAKLKDEESTEEEEEEEESAFISCRKEAFSYEPVENENEDGEAEIFQHLASILPFQMTNGANIGALMHTRLFTDLVQAADFDDESQAQLFETVMKVIVTSKNAHVLYCIKNCALGLLQSKVSCFLTAQSYKVDSGSCWNISRDFQRCSVCLELYRLFHVRM
jgi:hypothetical protein